MKSPRIRHIIWLLLLWLMPGSFVVMGQNVNEKSAQEAENVQDTIAPRYSVRKTVPGTLKDLSPHPADLQSPMNLRTEAEYDAKNRQILHTHKIREYRNRCTDGTDPRRISGLDIETIHAILLPPKERRTNRQGKRGFRLYGYEVQPWSGREVVWSRWGTDTYTR